MTIAYDYKTRTSYTEDAAAQKAAHKVLLEHTFNPSLPERGYTNRTLHIDLSTLKVTEKPVTQQMKDIFIGGRGFGLWYLWNAITPTTKWNDPENEIVISPGPLAGQHAVPRLRQVARRHALAAHRHPDRLQRRRLLRAAAEVLRLRRARDPGQGRARRHRRHRRPEGRRSRIEEAPEENPDSHVAAEIFTHEYADDAKDLRERLGRLGGQGRRAQPHRLPELLLVRPQARRGAPQAGRARRHRHGVPRQEDQGARRPRPEDQGRHEPRRRPRADRRRSAASSHKEIHDLDDQQCNMRRQGTAHLVEVMDAYDLLPVHNFQYGKHPDTTKIASHGLGQALHAGDPRRLLVRLPHGVREGRRRPRGDDRPLQGPHRHGGRARVRDVRRPRRRTAASSTPTGSSSRTSTATPTASTRSRSAPAARSRWSAGSAAS